MKTTTDFANKFANNVKKYLKKGKSGRIKSFYKEVINLYKDQIDILEKENEKITGEYGKLAKAKEDKLDFVFKIDIDKLTDVDSREKYANEYAIRLLQFDMDKIKPLNDKLEQNEKQIQILMDAIDFLETAEPIVEDEDESDE